MAWHLTIDRDPAGAEAAPAAPAPEAGLAPPGPDEPGAPAAVAGPTEPTDRPVLAFLRRLSAVLSVLTGGLAVVVLVAGWAIGNRAAAEALYPSTPIQPLAAACLLLLAISTWALAERSGRRRRVVGATCAVGALAVAAAVLVQYATGVDLGVDRLLFPDAVRAALPGAHPGRMAVEAAAAIGLLAAGHLVLRLAAGWAAVASQALTLAAGVVGVTDVYSVVYGYSFAAGPADARARLPLAAALALTALCLGTVAARPASGLTRVMTSDSVGAVMGRRMLAAALTVPFALGWVPILAQQNGLYGTRLGIAVLIVGNAVAFGAVSFVTANAASRLEAVGAAAQQAAQDSHAQLLALIDNTSAVIYMRDLAGRYMLVNREYERLFDVHRTDLVGRTDYDLFPIEMADAFRENDLAAVARGFPVQMEEIAPGDDGPHNYITVKFPILDEAGRAYAVCGISTDITDRTRAEAEVRRLNADLERRVRERTAELEASTRELDAFAYSVSHDLRAPLRSLDGFSQMLLDDYGEQLDEDGQDCLRRLQANTVRMGQIIDDLLNLSRATRVELRRSHVDLSELARTVLAELRQADPDRQVDVDVADHLATTGDPQLLRLVLANLIGNAWKFTTRTDGAAIGVELARDGDERVFAVRDNGAGFNMEYAAKLFEPFQRLHSRGEFDGSGLGLAIVARILRRHGGRIWAEGEPGRGATFYFTVTAPAEDHG
jgi:PAS domain S-box-containing protein